MSPIGRVFIVLNLILAGGFVAIAGTFLQRHTDYKQQFTAKSDELVAAQKSFDDNRAALGEQISTLDRELRGYSASLETEETNNKALTDENLRLTKQLADLAGDVKALNAHATTLAQAVDRSTQESSNAYKMAMAATHEKDQALASKEQSDSNLSEAGRSIQALEATVAEKNGALAALDQQTRELDVILAVIRRRAPGIFDGVQPDLEGIVEQAQAGICTVRLTANPGGVDVKTGWRFAIHNGSTYKGEAMITDVDGEFAFCRVTKLVPGMTVNAGDSAATNVGM